MEQDSKNLLERLGRGEKLTNDQIANLLEGTLIEERATTKGGENSVNTFSHYKFTGSGLKVLGY